MFTILLLPLAAHAPIVEGVHDDLITHKGVVAIDYDACYYALSPTEKDFMTMLTPYNQQIFCGLFDSKMRQEAIELTGQLDTNGNPMKADQAVQQTAQNNGIIVPMPPQEPPGAPSVGSN